MRLQEVRSTTQQQEQPERRHSRLGRKSLLAVSLTRSQYPNDTNTETIKKNQYMGKQIGESPKEDIKMANKHMKHYNILRH